MRSRHQKQVLNDLGSIFENVRTAWNWSLQSAHIIQLGMAADGLALFLELKSRLREGVNFFEAAIQRFETVNYSEPTEQRALGILLARYASNLNSVGQNNKALDLLKRAETIAKSTGNEAELAYCLDLRGWLITEMGGAQIEAVELWQQALSTYRRMALPWGISSILQNLAYHLPPKRPARFLKNGTTSR